MTLLIGVSWFVFWLLIDVFSTTADTIVAKGALITAILFILVGLIVDRTWDHLPHRPA